MTVENEPDTDPEGDRREGDAWVYLSDASWAPRGNRSGTRYHWPNPSDEALAACGRFVLTNSEPVLGMPAGEVPEHLRCKRRACARRWGTG